MVIDAAHSENKWIGMCDEVTGDPIAVHLLFELGLDEFNISVPSILPTRVLISQLRYYQMNDMSSLTLEKCTEAEIKSLVEEYLGKII